MLQYISTKGRPVENSLLHSVLNTFYPIAAAINPLYHLSLALIKVALIQDFFDELIGFP